MELFSQSTTTVVCFLHVSTLTMVVLAALKEVDVATLSRTSL
jgi:hypothetical protein